MKEAVKYVKQCLKMGLAKEVINQQLQEAGWEDEVIQAAWLEAKKSFKDRIWQVWQSRKILLIVPAALILLLAGGYLTYAKFFAGDPDRIWNKATANTTAAKSWKSRAEINYTDKSSAGEKFALTATNIGEHLLDGKKMPDFSLNSEAKIKTENLDFGFSLESRKVGQTLFYKLGDVPFLSSLLGKNQPAEAPKPQWFKIDLAEKTAEGNSIVSFVQNLQANLQGFEGHFWQLKLLKLTERLGSEKIAGRPMWHYKGQINKQEIQSYLGALTQNLDATEQLPELKTNISGLLTSFLEKLDFRKVEIWIGKKDKRIYQILIESNAPSFMSADLVNAPSTETKNFQQLLDTLPFTATLTIRSQFSNFDEPTTIDEPKGAVDYFEYLEKAAKTTLNAKAIADVRQIMTALELYFNDQKRYPERIGLLNLAEGEKPAYFTILPKPLTDPICAGINEFFNYQASPDGQSYAFDFCLTTKTEALSDGRHQASPQGIR